VCTYTALIRLCLVWAQLAINQQRKEATGSVVFGNAKRKKFQAKRNQIEQMGGGISKNGKALEDVVALVADNERLTEVSEATEEEGEMSPHVVSIVTHLMPLFYIRNAQLADTDMNIVRDTWSFIVEDNCSNYEECRRRGLTDQPNALVWFFTEFYGRLFDVHPSVKPLFKTDAKVQGRKLVSMISFLIRLMDSDVDYLHSQLKALARMHCAIGVTSNQYALMMDTLLWTLHHCLGKEVFTPARVSWLKCLSRVLQVLVPVHVVEEMRIRRKGKPR
jgi:hemoglobin-like flavoprotein